MCKNYWNADACRRCGFVSNVVAPGKTDPFTGQINTSGFMCLKAQERNVERNRHTQHLDKPLRASNIARCKMRQLCRDGGPGLDGAKDKDGDQEEAGGEGKQENNGSEGDDIMLIYMWKFCTLGCKRQHAAHMCKWTSPLGWCTGAGDSERDEKDEAGQAAEPVSNLPLAPYQRPLASPVLQMVMKKNLQAKARKL
ncbi:hypothetical protein PFICI_03064 [Pestalotiopsis fici W106-1]|uniref:Uncharacterized protein n=1 Tax=Pestalotiopsis fici (strain W106-1 / CGMCC3.15140) TaxID=1229662 RepID=W3XGA1_PESFW|nr:uncharacterized protein PFICI_03064 [Pestalotiopsis fici W106-1]ETS85039.1 hypothetical protein PFICI_03064 [Pestalotiopsis fici W106-1]